MKTGDSERRWVKTKVREVIFKRGISNPHKKRGEKRKYGMRRWACPGKKKKNENLRHATAVTPKGRKGQIIPRRKMLGRRKTHAVSEKGK